MSGALPIDLDVDKLEKIIRNLGKTENPSKNYLLKDDPSKKHKINCMRAVFKYIGKNKVATIEDYYNRDTIVSETIAMIRVCEKERR